MSTKLSSEFEGGMQQRMALRRALQELNDQRVSDQRVTTLLLDAKASGRIPGFPKFSKASISRATIQRIRDADEKALAGMRHATMAIVYNFLCQAEELPTHLFNEKTRIRSSHELAPLLESVAKHLGAKRGPLELEDLRSLEGVFHLYRKAWTSPDHDTYIRCVLRFEWVGDALFYTEEQRFFDPIAKVPVEESDSGIVLPYGMNVVLLGRGDQKDMLKFFSLHDFFPYPDGVLPVHSIAGNFIAVYSKGPHPGFQAFGKRVDAAEARSAFFGKGELDPNILEKFRQEPKTAPDHRSR